MMTYAVKNEDCMKSSKIVFEDKDRVEDVKMLKTRINELGRNIG